MKWRLRVAEVFQCFCLALLVAGCSRNYRVDFDLKTNDLLGTWKVQSAPLDVKSMLATNNLGGEITLDSDGKATLRVFPLDVINPNLPSPITKWTAISEDCKWNIRDWGRDSRRIWRLELQTQSAGIGLYVGKTLSGQLILDYTPDPDKPEHVIFKRLVNR